MGGIRTQNKSVWVPMMNNSVFSALSFNLLLRPAVAEPEGGTHQAQKLRRVGN